VDLVARRKAREQRAGDRRYRDVLVDGLVDRPPALARVLDVRRDLLEVRAVRLERLVEQVEEPRAHDRAVPPDAGDLLEVEVELGVLYQLEALGVRLHQSV